MCVFLSPRLHAIFSIIYEQWWIYKPPFDAAFVREQWESGYEVDTFHT